MTEEINKNEEPSKSYDYINQSRGHKTKGNQYKDRYVNDVVCPECQHTKAYKDTWKTRLAYTCLKRDCRHKWYKRIDFDAPKGVTTDES